jgi:dihydroceramide fatty acyl 2-hydroxylase
MSQEARTEALDASPRLFESDLLDKLSRVHHLTPVIVYCPIILGLLIYSLTLNSLTLVLIGVLVGYVGWTLTEYFGHR